MMRSSIGWNTGGRGEELQHGAALKRYVQTAWPGLRLGSGLPAASSPSTARCCTLDQLAPHAGARDGGALRRGDRHRHLLPHAVATSAASRC